MQIPEIHSDYRPIERILVQAHAEKLLFAAMEMQLFDALRQPATAEDVAQKIACPVLSTRRLLEALQSLELLDFQDGKFVNTPTASDFLVTDSAAYQPKGIHFLSNMYQVFTSDFTEVLRRGGYEGPGVEDWDGGEGHWAEKGTFEGMGSYALCGPIQDVRNFVMDLPGLSSMKRMCDIGGNHGFYSMALLETYPELTSTVCDLPHVVGPAQNFYAGTEFAQRLTTRAVDLSSEDSFGENYDLALASHVLYYWVGQLSGILHRVQDALRPGGWFVTSHFLRDPKEAVSYDLAFVNLLASLSGCKAHFIEKDALAAEFEAAGFQNIRSAEGVDTGLLILAGQKPD